MPPKQFVHVSEEDKSAQREDLRPRDFGDLNGSKQAELQHILSEHLGQFLDNKVCSRVERTAVEGPPGWVAHAKPEGLNCSGSRWEPFSS